MHVVILCDSKFGNTRHLAEAMQSALTGSHQVELRTPADGLPDRGAVDVLLVGGPTMPTAHPSRSRPPSRRCRRVRSTARGPRRSTRGSTWRRS